MMMTLTTDDSLVLDVWCSEWRWRGHCSLLLYSTHLDEITIFDFSLRLSIQRRRQQI